MVQIATKFVKWDVPELTTLQDCQVYKLRERLNNGGKLSREEKNWLTRNVMECSLYFKRGIALSGYRFDFSDILKRYFVKQYDHIHEYYAIDKTALRSILHGRIEDIVEVIH
ncbi:molybdenum ABC transporter ATP-binding protein [Bacteroides fragilis]|nr:molybdenum ABC transporter ATP-binding protein [Bacteroides fragilis]MCS2878871.1 molybdenum ABC transporter ATP-binding protein [Bacteroides fragilis]